ncbi:MAG: nuclear transport factor 2 family protein [Chitinophagaceae bacterium]
MQIRLIAAGCITCCCILVSCSNNQTGLREKSKTEIAAAEKEFEKMAAEKGIAEAFETFADTNATIKRQNDTLITGKKNIRNYYNADFYKTASVKWSPDFVDASESGDMGYTFGKYTWQSKDSTGKTNEYHGIFHTVWKKQNDGSWKYVWD